MEQILVIGRSRRKLRTKLLRLCRFPGGDLQSDGTGLSYDHNRRFETWNLDATLGVELDSTAFDATGFKYVLVLEGNSGRGDDFGARFDQYTVTASGASGAPSKIDPAYPINGVVPLLSFPGQLSNLSAVPGGVAFQQPIINVQNLVDFQASLPGATQAHLDAVITEGCIAGNSGAWRNNCLDWQVRTPSFDGDGNLRLEAINGASREGFRFSLLSEADLAVNKTIDGMDSGVVLSVGSTANYVITVTHAGGPSASSASLVSLRDVLPAEITLNGTASASQGSYDPATQVWTIGTLQIGESVTLTLPFEVTGGNSGDTVTNAISLSDVSMLQTDTNPANNETSVGFTIGAEIDANPETFSDIDSAAGGVTTSVLGSDTFDGGAATLSNVTITAPVAADYTDADGDPVTGLSLDPSTGRITVSAGTPAGTYKISYEICSQASSSNCATAVETVVVTNPGVPPITNPGPQTGRCFPTALNLSGGDLFDAAVISAANGTGTHTPAAQLQTIITGADISHRFPGFPAGSVIVDATYNRRNGTSIGVGMTASPPTATFTLSGTHPVYIEPQHGKALRPGDTDGFRALDGVEYALVSSLSPSVYTAYRQGNEYGVVRPSTNFGSTPTDQVRWSSVTPATRFEIFTTEPDADNNAAMYLAPTCTTSLNTTKAATTVAARNADGTFDVTYVITVENLSNINLRNMVVTDDLATQFGAAFVSVVSAPVVSPVGTLSAESSGLTGSSAWAGDGANMLAANGQLGTGDAINMTFTVRIDPAATSATAFENTATASGDRPDGTRISDKSDDVTDGGNGTPDEDTGTPTSVTAPTEVVATDDAETIDRSAADAGATGVVNLFDGDTVNGAPAGTTNATVVPVDPASVPGELTVKPDGSVDVNPGTAPGVYSFDYQLCSLDTVPVCETATATITVTPEIEAAPETFDTFGPAGGTTPSVLASDVLNGAAADLSTVDITAPVPGDYKDASGQPVTGLTLDPATGLITIDPGLAAGDYFVDYEICTKAAPVTCSTTTETITIGVPKLTLTLESGTPGTDGGTDPSVTDPGDTVPYTLTVTNDGDVTMEDIIITSADLNNIVCNPTTLAPGEMATCTADPHVITVGDFNTGGIEKTATVTGTSTAGPAEDVSDTRNSGGSETSDDPDLEGNTDGDPTSDPTIVPLTPLAAEAGAITVSKTANLSLVNYGDTVTYTLVYENTSALNIADLDLLDELPGGLAYTPGTAELDGVATEPSVAGRRLTWSGVDIAAGATVEVTLDVRVLPDSATEELVNSAWATQDGDVVSNIGTATIRIEAEHVFHCSDVIGKVFDDRNGNGIQDGPDSLAGLTDQTVTGGKFASAPAAENRGEPGLAGVRLVTVNGHLITTDAYGRFHVPCAALPADGGSSFTLKVDTRTLPSGYRMTTENPRVLRLTAGRFGRMNFGAAIADVARIDLDATAFATDRNGRPVAIPALDQALRAMLNDPANPVSVVHLRYHRAGSERPRTARRHLDLVEDILNDAWTGQSGTRLLVERETLRLTP